MPWPAPPRDGWVTATPPETLPPQPSSGGDAGTGPAPAPTPRRDRRALAAVAAVVVVAAVLGGALVLRGADDPEQATTASRPAAVDDDGATGEGAPEVSLDDGLSPDELRQLEESGDAEFHEVGDAIEVGDDGGSAECWPNELEEESGDPCAGGPPESTQFTVVPAMGGLAGYLPVEGDLAALDLAVDGSWGLEEDTNQLGGPASSFCLDGAPQPIELQWRRWAVPDEAEVSARITAMPSRSEATRAVVARQAPSFAQCMQIQARPIGHTFGELQPAQWKLGDAVAERDDRSASQIVVLTGADTDVCTTTMVYGWRQVATFEIATYVQTCAGEDEPDAATVDLLLDQIQKAIEAG